MSNKSDIFGYKKPVQIETGEWWFNGRIIQKQDHPNLSPYVSWDCDDKAGNNAIHQTFKAATGHALISPCVNPKYFPEDFIGPFDMDAYEEDKKDRKAEIKDLSNQIIKLDREQRKLQRAYAYRYAPIRPGDCVEVFWVSFGGLRRPGKIKEHDFYGKVNEIDWTASDGFIYEVIPTKKDFTPHGRHKGHHWVKEKDEFKIIEKFQNEQK